MIAEDLKALAVPINKLKPLPGNPRRGDVEAVRRSYERFGQRKPIVAQRDGTVIAGNHQLKAAQALGWSEMAVVWVDDDEQTAKAFALADNRTADLGSYDNEALAELLADVATDPELLLATGYSQQDLDDLLGSVDGGEEIEEPDAVPDSAPSKTVKGDVWLLGPHRLMCGDSTVPTDVERLMAGAKADMVWTDPPYGVNIQERDLQQAKVRGRRTDGKGVMNDHLKGDSLYDFLSSGLGNAYESCKPGAAWYVASPAGDLFHQFGKVLVSLGVWRHTLIWVKDQFVMGRADYHYRHEPIFYGWKDGASHTWSSDRKQDTVLEFPRPKRSEEHPTMKPVALISYCIGNSSVYGSLILDVFGGSGTTLIAAHGLGRIAYLMELDEHYCDVICKRFQIATGITPIAESTGNEHSFLEE